MRSSTIATYGIKNSCTSFSNVHAKRGGRLGESYRIHIDTNELLFLHTEQPLMHLGEVPHAPSWDTFEIGASAHCLKHATVRIGLM
jgi:hypothetical protein